MTRIDPYSLTTVPIEQHANGKLLGSATAFVWRRAEKHYLITNWHVVTGKNATDGCLELPIRPETLRTHFNTRVHDFGKVSRDIALYDNDGNPVWFIPQESPHFAGLENA